MSCNALLGVHRTLRSLLAAPKHASTSYKYVPHPPRSLNHHPALLSGRVIASSRPLLQHQSRCYATTPGSSLKHTPLYDLHLKRGGKMVPFGGYSMPVQYSDLGVGESHAWTREKASIFDVSHMVQHYLIGPGAQGLLQKLTPADLASIDNHRSTLSAFLHPVTGGIVDDTIITRLGPSAFYIVTNAACRDKDVAFLSKSIDEWKEAGGEEIKWEILEGQGLIALQGPLSAEILEPLLIDMLEDKLENLHFGQSKYLKVRLPSGKESSQLLVSRGGYTGEDGFEISIPEEETQIIVDFLLTTAGEDKLRLAGLGARDTLRLEAGMCLYGHDLDDSTTPVEGGLSWIIGKNRRTEGGFNGDKVILRQVKSKKAGGTGVSRRRVGLVVDGAPAREGAKIVDAEGNDVGAVTSGCPSPTLKRNIAMGYVKDGLHKAGTEVSVVVRGKARKATVTKMPFVPSKYWRGGLSPG